LEGTVLPTGDLPALHLLALPISYKQVVAPGREPYGHRIYRFGVVDLEVPLGRAVESEPRDAAVERVCDPDDSTANVNGRREGETVERDPPCSPRQPQIVGRHHHPVVVRVGNCRIAGSLMNTVRVLEAPLGELDPRLLVAGASQDVEPEHHVL